MILSHLHLRHTRGPLRVEVRAAHPFAVLSEVCKMANGSTTGPERDLIKTPGLYHGGAVSIETTGSKLRTEF